MRQPLLGRLLVSALALSLLSACSTSASSTTGRPRVLASTGIIADVVTQIAGQQIQLDTLIPPGSDPHSFEPSPADLALIAQADLILINGLGLEETLGELLAGLDQPSKIVPVSATISALEGEGDEEEEHEDESAEHPHLGLDPHGWMNPLNVVAWTETIAAALSDLDPTHAADYQANAAEYRTDLITLDTWAIERISTIPAERRLLVTDHDALAYFAEHYGFEVVGALLPGYSSLGEPSAADLANLQAAIAQYEVPAIFVGGTVNPALASQIAADSGLSLVPIYTGALSDSDGPAATYLDLIHYDVDAIVEALR